MVRIRTEPVQRKGAPLWQYVVFYLVAALLLAGFAIVTGWTDDKPPMAVAVLFGIVGLLGLYYLVSHYKNGFIDWK
jgi:hypothetical protein